MTAQQFEHARVLLCRLQDSVRDALIAVRDEQTVGELSEIAEVTAADTIYRIDKVSEAAIVAWFAAYWPAEWPVELVMEGAEGGDAHTFPHGTPVSQTKLKCILDPIDGTRGLMYDKRSAWVLRPLTKPYRAWLCTKRGSPLRSKKPCLASCSPNRDFTCW